MADRFITRTVAALLGVVVLALCMPASAGLEVDPPGDPASKAVSPIANTTLYQCGYPGGNDPAPWKTTASAACAAFWSSASLPGHIFATKVTGDQSCQTTTNYSLNTTTFNITTTVVGKVAGLPPGWCGTSETRTVNLLIATKTGKTCPDNASPDNPDEVNACTCGGGFKANPSATACVPDCNAGRVASSGYYDVGPQAGGAPKTVACAGACQVVFDGVSPAGSAMVDGEKHWFAKGSYAATGGACTPAKQETDKVGEGQAKLPDGTCKAGESAGTINGKSVCYKADTGEQSEESKNKATDSTTKTKTTNADGSVTETEVRTRVDAKGNKEVTTTTTTTGPDGSQTTSKTVENPLPGTTLSGDKGKTGDSTGGDNGSSGDDGEKSECERNPSSAGCGGQPATVGTLYSAKDKTMSGVLTAHRDAFMASPMGSAAGGFFVVSGGGACPTFQRHIPFINTDLVLDQFCTPFASDALAVLKGALLLCCSFFAFRVAVE